MPSPVTTTHTYPKGAEAKQAITKRDLAVALRYTHMVANNPTEGVRTLATGPDQTVCGLLPAYETAEGDIDIPIGCACGHDECTNKPNCPICLSISTGVVN